ncbi:MAG: hypothetical protein GX993_01190, partial [Bacteroidales bacterium]|nr:hypothetical protein [Bacteroidales bacterium]
MKKFFAIITLISMIIFVGCVDVDELWNEIDSLKKENQEQADELGKYKERLKIVEDLTSLANSDIAAIKAIVDALNKNVSIVSYKELADKSGYQLTMSDGSTITLRHGLKGDKGDRVVIGSKAFGKENRLYWTLDGEFLLDADGNKIPVTGDKGARGDSGSRGPTGFTGISPILRVNENGNWEVSYDYGKGWQEVKDKSGNPVSALGSQGESGEDGAAPSLSITETPQTVTITLNGDEYVIPKGNAISQIDPSLLIGQWNVLKYQDYSDENGQWGDWEEIEAIFNAGYHFMDDSNGSYPYFTNFGLPMNHAFDYVVTGDKLLISELEWNHGAVGKAVMTKSPGYYLDTLTIIQLDDENLILEYNSKYGRFREHLTRGVVPNPLSFVAEYNIAGQGHYFVDDLTYNHISDYYNYYIGVMEYKSGHMIPDGAGGAYCYYLPRIEEWQSIVPGNKD